MLSEQVVYLFVSLLSVCYLSWHPYLSISMFLTVLFIFICVLYFYSNFYYFLLFLIREDNIDMQEMQCHEHVNLCGLTCFKKRPCAISCKQCLERGSGEVIRLSQLWFYKWINSSLGSELVVGGIVAGGPDWSKYVTKRLTLEVFLVLSSLSAHWFLATSRWITTSHASAIILFFLPLGPM